MLKAPHSFRQINDVLIIVAVWGAPLGSANVRVGCICVCVCVCLCCRYTSNGKAGEWLDWLYRGEMGWIRKVVLVWLKKNNFSWIQISGVSAVSSCEVALSNHSLAAFPFHTEFSITQANRPKIKIQNKAQRDLLCSWSGGCVVVEALCYRVQAVKIESAK